VREQRYDHRYESKRRLASYWHQVDETLQLGGRRALLVGRGSGTTESMLKRNGLEVVSVDIEAARAPTVVGDVTRLPFRDATFDVGICCQVLEHVPFELFTQGLGELRRVCTRGVVLSLPDQGRVFRLDVKLPRFSRQVLIALPRLRRRSWRYDGQHHWEVNAAGFEPACIDTLIERAGFVIETSYRVFENPYHRFWRLRCV
jgi:SAM-dependent methyltransferase